jgi:hypothetical protein
MQIKWVFGSLCLVILAAAQMGQAADAGAQSDLVWTKGFHSSYRGAPQERLP